MHSLDRSTAASPLSGAKDQVRPDLRSLQWIGEKLVRPECVLANANSDLYSSD
jgi:hypothetical protein